MAQEILGRLDIKLLGRWLPKYDPSKYGDIPKILLRVIGRKAVLSGVSKAIIARLYRVKHISSSCYIEEAYFQGC
jgi:hypothetical protein